MKSFLIGGIAGFIESSCCQPLDVLKTRFQSNNKTNISLKNEIIKIYKKDGIYGFYRGLSAVYLGVIPKNAIRFSTFDFLNQRLQNPIVSGFGAGICEAIIVVNPLETCKIRVQSQYHSFITPQNIPKLSLFQMAKYMIQTEGIKSFYNGLTMTIIRQSINQAANFYVYFKLKDDLGSFVAGCISGSIGPIVNNPIDVIKTRLQIHPKKQSIPVIIREIYQKNGIRGYFKGIIPRLIRIIPGQGITFFTYDFLQSKN